MGTALNPNTANLIPSVKLNIDSSAPLETLWVQPLTLTRLTIGSHNLKIGSSATSHYKYYGYSPQP